MNAKLSSEQRNALKHQPEGPLTIEDEESHRVYVLIPQDRFQKLQRLLYDDSDLSGAEMLALAAQALNDPDGWGAPGMEEYDNYDSKAP